MPTITSLEFENDHLVRAGEEIVIHVGVFDDNSGLSSINMSLVSASGKTLWFYGEEDELVEGESFVLKNSTNEYVEAGEWIIGSFSLSDQARNTYYFDQYSNNDDDFDFPTLTIENDEQSDVTAPDLVDFSFVNPSVQAGDDVVVHITMADDVSGVEYISFTYLSPSGRYFSYGEDVDTDYWEYLGDNVYECKIATHEFTENGEWNLTSINSQDIAGNYGYTDLYSFEEVPYFEVSGGDVDEVDPVFVSLTLEDYSITAGDDLVVILEASDALSGLSEMTFEAYSDEDGEFDEIANYDRQEIENWTDLGDNKYSYTYKTLSVHNNGEWYFDEILLQDVVGNYIEVESGLPTFNISGGVVDEEEPVLENVLIKNGVVTFEASDDAGILALVLEVENDNNEEEIVAITSLNVDVEEGAVLIEKLGGNLYQFDLPDYLGAGTWTVENTILYDYGYNDVETDNYNDLSFEIEGDPKDKDDPKDDDNDPNDGGDDDEIDGDNDPTYKDDNETSLSSINGVEIEMYPNPASDVVMITGIENDYSVIVTDMTGQQVNVELISGQLQVSSLSQGTYIVTVSDNDETVVSRFTKL